MRRRSDSPRWQGGESPSPAHSNTPRGAKPLTDDAEGASVVDRSGGQSLAEFVAVLLLISLPVLLIQGFFLDSLDQYVRRVALILATPFW